VIRSKGVVGNEFTEDRPLVSTTRWPEARVNALMLSKPIGQGEASERVASFIAGVASSLCSRSSLDPVSHAGRQVVQRCGSVFGHHRGNEDFVAEAPAEQAEHTR
jgi:hypothetical protein